MKSEIEIKDELFAYLKTTTLVTSCTGVLSKTIRKANSQDEDIIISVISSNVSQTQEAIININIYVQDLIKENQHIENSTRLRTLANLCKTYLRSIVGSDFICNLTEQKIIASNESNEHLINNRMLYRLYED